MRTRTSIYLVPTWMVWVVWKLLDGLLCQDVFLVSQFSHSSLIVHHQLLVVCLVLFQTLLEML